jgi:hypothetical protein
VTALQQSLATTVLSAGKSQAWLAAETGYTEKHISQMMRGKEEGSLTAWQRLLDAAGVVWR